MFCRAGFAFSTANPGTLTLRPGDVVQLLRLRKGWAKGRKLADNTQGWAPIAYLDVVPRKEVDKAWEVLSEEESGSDSGSESGSGSGSESEGESGSESASDGEGETQPESRAGAKPGPRPAAPGARAAPAARAAPGGPETPSALQARLQAAQAECARLGVELARKERALEAAAAGREGGRVEVVYALDAGAELQQAERRTRELEARALAAEREARELRAELARRPEPPAGEPAAEALLSLAEQGLLSRADDVLRALEEAGARPAGGAPQALLDRLAQQERELARCRALLGAQAEMPPGLTVEGMTEQLAALRRENALLSQRLADALAAAQAASLPRPPAAGPELLRRRRAGLALTD